MAVDLARDASACCRELPEVRVFEVPQLIHGCCLGRYWSRQGSVNLGREIYKTYLQGIAKPL